MDKKSSENVQTILTRPCNKDTRDLHLHRVNLGFTGNVHFLICAKIDLVLIRTASTNEVVLTITLNLCIQHIKEKSRKL